MQVIDTRELERLVRRTFPEKRHFSADKELGPDAHRWPVVTFVHSGTDVFLDRQFDDWLRGSPIFVSVQEVSAEPCPSARSSSRQ
jgi:hypothetical protein